MRPDLLELAADLARRGEPFALATVVGRQAPVSTHVGDAALVTRDGRFHGWVGGSCTRPTVLAEAQQALADGRPRRILLDPDPQASRPEGARWFPMTCHSGGSVEIHIQPVLPAPHLLVFGIAPTARALARLAHAMGYRVSAVDPLADAHAFPGADTVPDPAALRVAKGTAPLYAVVATQGQWDEEAILAAIAQEPDYLAVVASAKRFAEMRSGLGGKASGDALGRIKNPAGLDLGAQTPEEIALSILAEIVQQRPRPQPRAEDALAVVEAVDPVCGMSVAVKGARHRAQHGGEEYYFCCAGCREKFAADPGRYHPRTG